MLRYFNRKEWLIILFPSLGYFVDLYDLLIFGSIKNASLISLGLTDINDINKVGVGLFNYQIGGMLLGGFVFGYFSDRYGRLKSLYFSIIIYSVANLLNAFISSIPLYYALRFLAGFGIAGELGSAIAHIGESLPREKRTYATMVIATLGMLGATTAGLLGWIGVNWRLCYIIGGILGIVVLFFRTKLHHESEIFNRHNLQDIEGNSKLSFIQQFSVVFTNLKHFSNYAFSCLVGAPVFFFVGIVILIPSEYSKAFNMSEVPSSGASIVFAYLMISAFDVCAAFISKKAGSRRKTIIGFIIYLLIAFLIFILTPTLNNNIYYLKIALIGVGIGYWGTMITNASEIFSTKVRGFVTTSVPNVIRFLGVLESKIFFPLKDYFGLINTTLVLGLVLFAIALIAAFLLPEQFEKSLDF